MLSRRVRLRIRKQNTLDTAVRIESTRSRRQVRADQPDAWTVYDALGNRVVTLELQAIPFGSIEYPP
jgi:hypothetical protein